MTHNNLSGSAGFAVQARTISGGIHVGLTPPLRVPAYLPPAPRDWENQEPALKELNRLSGPEFRAPGLPAAVQIIGSTPGVGTTALATLFAHSQRPHYPGGQLVESLGASYRTPPTVREMLRRFIRAMGVPTNEIPTDLGDMVGLFRSLSADQALLILLDDVPANMDLTQLMPACSSALLLVTARTAVESLVRQRVPLLRLDPLDPLHARSLLTRIADKPLPDNTLNNLVAASGGIPATISLIGARLHRCSPQELDHAIHALIGEHTAATPCEATMDDLERNDAWIDRTLQSLTNTRSTQEEMSVAHAVARLHVLRGLYPAGQPMDIDLMYTLAAPIPGGHAAVDTLLELELLTVVTDPDTGQRRVSVPDSVDAHARRALDNTDASGGITVQDRKDAVRIMCDYMWVRANRVNQMVTPYRTPPPYDCTQPAPPDLFADKQHALDWIDRERQALLPLADTAFEHDLPETAWHLADAYWAALLHRKHPGDRERTDWLGVRAAEAWIQHALADTTSGRTPVDIVARLVRAMRASAEMMKRFGRGLGKDGQYDTAKEWLHRSYSAYEAIGDEVGMVDVVEAGAQLAAYQHHFDTAIGGFADALENYQRLGEDRKAALSLLNLGLTYLAAASDAGEHDGRDEHLATAHDFLRSAVTGYRALKQPDHYNMARVHQALGRTYLALHHATHATAELTDALTTFAEYDNHAEAKATLLLLADTARLTDDREREIEYLIFAQERHTVYQRPPDPVIEQRLADLAPTQ